MKLSLLFSVLINAMLFCHVSQADDSRKKPNVVLVFADDLGIEALNAYGGHGVNTPHLDKLAKEGMLFSHCFANPACTPSRAELLTGTYPSFIGFQHVLGNWKDDHYLDPQKFNSFANQLKKAGYATAVAGKWNISWLERNDTVKALGFDEHCLWQMFDRDGVKRSRFYQPYFRINGSIKEQSIADRFGPDVLADFMIDFIKRKKDQPFLIYYPALLVHTPYVRVPGGPKTNALPDNKQKSGTECFPEMVEYLDKNVGRLMKTIDEQGIRENTMVIFCADNGTHSPVKSIWGEKRIKIKGGKMTMTDRGSRSPVVSWPARSNRARSLIISSNWQITYLPFLTLLASRQCNKYTSKLPAAVTRKKRSGQGMGAYRVQEKPANPNQGMDLHQSGKLDQSEPTGTSGKPSREGYGSPRNP